ncbi:hypothetical protein IL38_16480 [Actinopolyspora erythraea]|uniref:Uncharacterized protein n=1 Tax=Actinopolyspora erythraea TaxID=414996 RepID=A0ABR4X1N9_9ACTN|nr:hypothetical protein IL38_16480 [Actinopolyspora erythraea]
MVPHRARLHVTLIVTHQSIWLESFITLVRLDSHHRIHNRADLAHRDLYLTRVEPIASHFHLPIQSLNEVELTFSTFDDVAGMVNFTSFYIGKPLHALRG